MASPSSSDSWSGSATILAEGALDSLAGLLSRSLLGHKVKLYLVSSELIDPATGSGQVSSAWDLAFPWSGPTSKSKAGGSSVDVRLLSVRFDVPDGFGRPGALLVHSTRSNEFFLKSVSVKSSSDNDSVVHFPCNSWIEHVSYTSNKSRVFFSNNGILPSNTPQALVKLREEDLLLLRGDGRGERKDGERIYDYDFYNDLGNATNNVRQVLGGSSNFPYPRRCRTGRKLIGAEKKIEERVSQLSGENYVPRDDKFSALKQSLFQAAIIRSFGHDFLSVIQHELFDKTTLFQSFEELHRMFVGDLKTLEGNFTTNTRDGTFTEFPIPGVVRANKEAWLSDLEFGRQRLAGVNPLCIQQLQEFPIVSKADPKKYGAATSTIKGKDIEGFLEDGLSVEEAIKSHKLYILEYHDFLLPYVNKINENTEGKVYASRTILYLTNEGRLTPIVIELTLPPTKEGEKSVSKIFKASHLGSANWPWRLAKAHVLAIDSGVHELISHWLRTHACVEPFIIATRRQLSTMHPIYIFLTPHFKDTMNINALARSALINADGIIERTFSPGKYSLEISSVLYKDWRFDEQALPRDLIKRGMAVEDVNAEHGLRLMIEDYPFAKDGLDVWAAIEDYAKDYVAVYYGSDEDVRGDSELQAWWLEVQQKGHADHATASWWPELHSPADLSHVLTTLAWLASGHHAAVNFSQYAFYGYMPNMPTKCRRLIPDKGTPAAREMMERPEEFYLNTVCSQEEATVVMATVEVLAQHMGEEEYLGQRGEGDLWTSDAAAKAALDRFEASLRAVEERIERRNAQAAAVVCDADAEAEVGEEEKPTPSLLHRLGPALFPYTFLMPSGTEGLSHRGIPNSISI